MLKNSRWLVLFGLAGLLFLATKACSPVPRTKEKDCLTDQGIIARIEVGGKNDLVFKLENNSKNYYIKLAKENAPDLDHFKSQLMGQMVVVKYPRYWTPLDPLSRTRQVRKVEVQDSTYYSDFKGG
jgi:hypothetical protein